MEVPSAQKEGFDACSITYGSRPRLPIFLWPVGRKKSVLDSGRDFTVVLDRDKSCGDVSFGWLNWLLGADRIQGGTMYGTLGAVFLASE
jgi:hypothetical protein